jgi:5-methylcytosine-specific restriction endonuclease McrA
MSPGSPEWIRWFYRSTGWRRKRKDILVRDNYECQQCKREGAYSKAKDVHHIKRLDAHPELALVDDNLESLCARCHNKAHPEKSKSFETRQREALTPERW